MAAAKRGICSASPAVKNIRNRKNDYKHEGMQMNASTRWIEAALIVMLLALLFGGGWFYRMQEQTMRQEKETDLSAIVRLKAQQIKAWREERLGDAAVLQENPLFIREAARFHADPRDENTLEIRALFHSLSKRYSYADVLLADPDGRVRLSLSGQTEAPSGYASTFAAALRDRKPVFLDLYIEGQNPTPRISVIAPLFTGDEQTPKPVGAVILVCDASQFLYPVVESWPTPTKTTETMLIRRDGDDVLILNDLRHQPDTALKLRIPLSRTEAPAVMAVLGKEGVVRGKDYRGVEVLSAIQPVPDSPWYMVAKTDAAEAFAEGRFHSVLILALLMGLVGMMVLLGLVVRQREQKKRYRELYQSELSLRASVERHSITLKAIGDAVIATDARGRIELLNPVAERLTGWSDDEARGRPLEEVFRIVNEQTRAEVANPVARVLREGVVVGLANHTLLIAKDGAERPIADSGAPMRAHDGTIIGVVLVFRDQGAERRVQRLTQVRLDLIAYAAAHTLDELVRKTLDEVGTFLDSPIGFYHFLESDQKTLSLQQWSTRTLKEFCRAKGKGLHYSIDQAGVWVDCVQERKPVIHNDYFSLEHKKGMPEGHAEVVRELVAPVMREGKVVAILGVGNKPVDYTEEDAETVSYLADVTWEILERRRAEEALRASEEKFRLAFLTSPDSINLNRAHDGVYLDSSEGFRKIMGYAREDVIGKSSLELNIWDDPKDRERLVNGLTRQGVVENMEARFRGKDGRIRIGLMSACVLRINQEDVILSITRDITEFKRAETALRESEELYRKLVSLSPDAISVVDLNGSLIFTSPRARELFGDWPEDEILGRSIFSWVAPKDQKKASTNIQRLLTEGTLTGAEYTLIKKDGTRFIGEVNAAVIHSPDGSPMSMIVITRDVTERKRAEEVLRESEQRFRSMVENSPFAYQALDIDGCYIDVNQKLCDLLGYRPDELLGRSFSEFWPENTQEIFTQAFETFKRDRQVSSELLLITKDGREVSVILEGRVEQDNDGNFLRTHCILTDITRRKLAEIALRESEERFSRFFRATPVGTSITRLSDGRYADVNDAWLGLFGYTREEIVDQNAFKLGIWADREDQVKVVGILREQGRIKDFETRFRWKSGEIGDVLYSADLIEVAGQQYILGLTHDITERKRVQEEKEKLEAQLFQAQKIESVGRLAGGVAHDFNNMLGVIIGRTEMALNKDVSTDELHHHLKEILNAGQRSADLTRQLLAFARKQTAVPKILDLNDTISGMLKMLRRLIGEDIDLFWAPELDLWKVRIDPSQVDQILANLVVNARDAISGVGAITMRTENVVIDDSDVAETPEFIPGEYVLLTTSDTGEGMSQEVCGKVFEPFFTTKEVGKGTGLGLSTVCGIVKQNEGFIYVDSEPGKGTTFKIYLPRLESETTQVSSEVTAGTPPTGTETILLVEDDEPILNLSKIILEKLGYTVLAARAPGQAIDLVTGHPGDIHLLITDVVMPEMSGRELAEQLRAIRPNLKCLYMSGYTADLIAHRGILDEGVNFIQKPFGNDDFAERVRQVLDQLE